MIGREREAEDGVGGSDGQGRRVIAGAGTGPRFELVREAPTGEALADVRGENSVTDATMDSIADEVSDLLRSSALRCAFEVGRLVAERMFRGDAAAWHKPGPKAVAVRGLATLLADRGVCSAQVLHGCLATYEVGMRCGDILTSKCLTPSHVRAVMRLRPSDQDELIREAETHRWSVRDLRSAVNARHGPSRLGRPTRPVVLRTMRQIEHALAPDGAVFNGLAGGCELSLAEHAELQAHLVRVREYLDRLNAVTNDLRATARESSDAKRRGRRAGTGR